MPVEDQRVRKAFDYQDYLSTELDINTMKDSFDTDYNLGENHSHFI